MQITPNAKKTEILGISGDVLRLKLQAPPVDGKANDALIRYIADVLDVPKSTVHITHGQSGRKKLLEIRSTSLTPEGVMRDLLAGL